MRTIVYPLHDQLGPDYGLVGCLGCVADPELHPFLPIRADHELFCGRVIDGFGCDASGETSMVHFSKAEGSEILKSLRPLQTLFMVLVRLEDHKGLDVKQVLHKSLDGLADAEETDGVHASQEPILILIQVNLQGVEDGHGLPGADPPLLHPAQLLDVGMLKDARVVPDHLVDILEVPTDPSGDQSGE